MAYSATSPAEPEWLPTVEDIAAANMTQVASHLGLAGPMELHRWSVEHRAEFWALVIERLGIVFREPPSAILGPGGSPDSPQWLPGARLNITESCFRHDPGRIALVFGRRGFISRLTYGELHRSVNRFANGYVAAGLGRGDSVGIAMPMGVESVIAYLGIVAAGGVVVSIADSFASDEIAIRLRTTGADVVITQDRMQRGDRELPMYDKVVAAGARMAVVVSTGGALPLREEDVLWNDFLSDDDDFSARIAEPGTHTNVLFSSGTTGEPKAIPWTHLTPIKAAMDAHFHHDVHPEDILAWPTNLGWMMGPWLIYSSLLNGAALALYDDRPTDAAFGRFVQDAGVTMLGVVPSMVAAWRSSGCLEGLDWSAVSRFSSTGEASNPDDMAWLMHVSGDKPVLEYCGGTEIGGAYLCGSMVQPCVPSLFSMPALGLDLRILDDDASATTSGELFLVPPSIGLSLELLNDDHHEVYYRETPSLDGVLRRHGDHIERLAGGYFRAQGRVDDTMNLGGVKVSSAELERAMAGVPGVEETAAVAMAPEGGGPSRLVVFVVPAPGVAPDRERWIAEMQDAIRTTLNPLFKIHDVVPVDALPRTSSQKVMRRFLRAGYEAS